MGVQGAYSLKVGTQLSSSSEMHSNVELSCFLQLKLLLIEICSMKSTEKCILILKNINYNIYIFLIYLKEYKKKVV